MTILLLLQDAAMSFQFKSDSLEDCSDRVSECLTSSTFWYDCPITCAESLQLRGSMHEVHDDPEEFFQLEVTKADGKRLSLEDHEGYVNVYAVLPLEYPGMAQFYYDMFEHIGTVFPFTVEIMVLPWQEPPEDHATKDVAARLVKNHEKPRVLVLESTSQSTNELDYLTNAGVVAGNVEPTLYVDRVTIFLVTADGMFIERLVSPPMPLLERRISVHLKQLAFTVDL